MENGLEAAVNIFLSGVVRQTELIHIATSQQRRLFNSFNTEANLTFDIAIAAFAVKVLSLRFTT